MPHSTHSTSDSRASSLHRSVENGSRRSMTSPPGHSKPTNGTPLVGTALTSRDERNTLPSQNSNAWKRTSEPVVPDGFAELLRSGGNIDELLASRKAGDRGSLASRQPGDRSSVLSSNTVVDRRRTQYYEEQFQYKDNVMKQTQDRVQRESPVIAELRTNVIVGAIGHTKATLGLTCYRSRMSSHW